MKRNIRFVFKSVADNNSDKAGVTIIIRTDARHATASIRKNLIKYLDAHSKLAFNKEAAQASEFREVRIEKAVHMAYQEWGHNVMSALADCLDYERYGLSKPEDRFINVHF